MHSNLTILVSVHRLQRAKNTLRSSDIVKVYFIAHKSNTVSKMAAKVAAKTYL